MPPNLKSVVTQCSRGWRSIGSRHFSSQAQTNVDPPLPMPTTSFNFFGRWLVAGFATYFFWDVLDTYQIDQIRERDIKFREERRKRTNDKLRALGVDI